jgi:hypothetical protein
MRTYWNPRFVSESKRKCVRCTAVNQRLQFCLTCNAECTHYVYATKIPRNEINPSSDIVLLSQVFVAFVPYEILYKLIPFGFTPLKSLNRTFKNETSNINILSYFLCDVSQM